MTGIPVASDNRDAYLSDVEIPAGYEQYREPNLYVRFGDGSRALRRAVPDHDFDSTFLEDWFFDGIVANLDVSSIALPGDVHTSEEAHRHLVGELKARWGDHSFSTYEPELGIGRFVNYAGAFVALSWRKVGERLIVVESQDLVEVLVVESTPHPDTSDPAALWQHYRKAANADDVDSLLNKLRQEP